MRIALLVHAFPPRAVTGVEVHAEALARALVAAGNEVVVLAPERDPDAVHLAQREERREGLVVTWLNLVEGVDEEATRREAPGAAAAVGRFLDRERPNAVVALHLLRLGPGALDEARRRDLPTIFVAQDAFAATDELNLVQPDLAPLAPADPVQAARCRLARGVLDAHLEAHDGFLVPGSEGPEVEAVRRVLAGEGEDADEVRRLAARLAAGVRQRLDALERCDRVEAPTEFLAGVLRAAGLRREVAVRPLGIERAALDAAPRPERRAGQPLRVLQLGGLYEHKGAHVLLEAAAGLEGVRVTLRGTAGSSAHGARLARLAKAVGAELGGPYTRAELPALLAEADLVAVPSLWPENAPFVIREAFAAGRPVLASDTPALRESVRDGVDGRLLRQGDAAAWRAALCELAQDGAAYARLAAGVRPPLAIEEDAAALRAELAELVREREAERVHRLERLPASVRALAARHAELERLPQRELVRRAAEGLAARARAAGVELPGLEALPLLVGGTGERLRERLADLARAGAWRAEQTAAGEAALRGARDAAEEARRAAASEAARADWQARLVAEREERLAWLGSVLADREAEALALRGELALARRGAEEAQRRAAWREEVAAGSEAEREALARELAWMREQLADRAAHLAELEQRLAAEERRGAAEAEASAGALSDLRAEYEALLADREALVGTVGELKAALEPERGEGGRREARLCELEAALAEEREERGATAARLEALEAEHRALGEAHAALAADREAARRHERHLEGRLAALEQELAWRRDEMRALLAELRAPLVGRGARKARRRLAGWGEVERRADAGEGPR